MKYLDEKLFSGLSVCRFTELNAQEFLPSNANTTIFIPEQKPCHAFVCPDLKWN